VDGAHINIKALPSTEGSTASSKKSASSPKPPGSPQEVVSGIFASIYSAGKSLAVTVADSAKKFDEQYQVTDKVSTAASTAWTATRDTALSVDEKLKISETTTKRTEFKKCLGQYLSLIVVYSDVKTKVSGSSGKASPSPSMSGAKEEAAASPKPQSVGNSI